MWQHGICIGEPEHFGLSQPMPTTPRHPPHGEFQRRVMARAQKQYALDVTPAWLADLRKHGLIPSAQRVGMAGRAPVYAYDRHAYRRALQLVRLKSIGVVGRDSMRLQLFASGCLGFSEELRSAAVRELERAQASMSAAMRSSLPRGHGRPTPGRLKAFLGQVGPNDTEFAAAGLHISPGVILDLMRTALNGKLRLAPATARNKERMDRAETFDQMIPIALPDFSGVLISEKDTMGDRQATDSLTALVQLVPGHLFEVARDRMREPLFATTGRAESEMPTARKLDCRVREMLKSPGIFVFMLALHIAIAAADNPAMH